MWGAGRSEGVTALAAQHIGVAESPSRTRSRQAIPSSMQLLPSRSPCKTLCAPRSGRSAGPTWRCCRCRPGSKRSAPGAAPRPRTPARQGQQVTALALTSQPAAGLESKQQDCTCLALLNQLSTPCGRALSQTQRFWGAFLSDGGPPHRDSRLRVLSGVGGQVEAGPRAGQLGSVMRLRPQRIFCLKAVIIVLSAK